MAKKKVSSLEGIKKDILEFNTKGVIYLVIIVIAVLMLTQVLSQGGVVGNIPFVDEFLDYLTGSPGPDIPPPEEPELPPGQYIPSVPLATSTARCCCYEPYGKRFLTYDFVKGVACTKSNCKPKCLGQFTKGYWACTDTNHKCESLPATKWTKYLVCPMPNEEPCVDDSWECCLKPSEPAESPPPVCGMPNEESCVMEDGSWGCCLKPGETWEPGGVKSIPISSEPTEGPLPGDII